MATSFEELKILQVAEAIADDTWKRVVAWDEFARDVVGGQLARAADSIGADIAEAFGRYHYGDKLQFLYYARGSLFETKYWLNRARMRDLISSDQTKDYSVKLTDLARQLNASVSSVKSQRSEESTQTKTRRVRESTEIYTPDVVNAIEEPLFSETELQWLLTIPTPDL